MSDYEFGSDGQIHEPASAAQALRAFEDTHLGKDAPRHAGQVEKGHGSLFQRLSPEQRKAHAAIEKTVETENKVNAARAALAAAEGEHNQAITAAEAASQVRSSRGPTVEEYVAAGYRAENYPPHGYESRSTREEIDAAIAKQAGDDASRQGSG